MEEEIWKDVKDFEGIYQISNLGKIKSTSRLKPHNINKICTKIIPIFWSDFYF